MKKIIGVLMMLHILPLAMIFINPTVIEPASKFEAWFISLHPYFMGWVINFFLAVIIMFVLTAINLLIED